MCQSLGKIGIIKSVSVFRLSLVTDNLRVKYPTISVYDNLGIINLYFKFLIPSHKFFEMFH